MLYMILRPKSPHWISHWRYQNPNYTFNYQLSRYLASPTSCGSEWFYPQWKGSPRVEEFVLQESGRHESSLTSWIYNEPQFLDQRNNTSLHTNVSAHQTHSISNSPLTIIEPHLPRRSPILINSSNDALKSPLQPFEDAPVKDTEAEFKVNRFSRSLDQDQLLYSLKVIKGLPWKQIKAEFNRLGISITATALQMRWTRQKRRLSQEKLAALEEKRIERTKKKQTLRLK